MSWLASTTTESSQALQPFLERIAPWLYYQTGAWTAVGFLGQAVFTGRFIVQWLYSEKKGQIVVPVAFWWLSFLGSIINLFYALHVDKLPIIIGFIFLPILNGRNLWLYYHPKPKAE
jgi:lipid-A-disaccharide synthase-like uncharacterized protein